MLMILKWILIDDFKIIKFLEDEGLFFKEEEKEEKEEKEEEKEEESF